MCKRMHGPAWLAAALVAAIPAAAVEPVVEPVVTLHNQTKVPLCLRATPDTTRTVLAWSAASTAPVPLTGAGEQTFCLNPGESCALELKPEPGDYPGAELEVVDPAGRSCLQVQVGPRQASLVDRIKGFFKPSPRPAMDDADLFLHISTWHHD